MQWTTSKFDRYVYPASVDEALTFLAEQEGRVRIIAGGTDLMLLQGAGDGPASMMVDVTRIPGLDTVSVNNGLVCIGPTVTHSEIIDSGLLWDKARPLVQACQNVGSPQIRNCATVAGNLVNASPAADTAPPLCALGASVVLASQKRGAREIPLERFVIGVRRTVLEPDEMLVSIQFPSLQANERATFLKLGLRQAQAIAVVSVAVFIAFDCGRVSLARITLGSVAPTVIRAAEAEGSLTGKMLSDEAIARAGDLAAEASRPIDDIRASAAYRRAVVGVLTKRALRQLREGTDGAGRPQPTGQALSLNASSVAGPAANEPISFEINGRSITIPRTNKTLLQVLRDDLRLTGTKEGCGEGECGSCTVLVEGRPLLSCILPAMKVHGRKVVTIEGVASSESSRPLLQAFVEEGAAQCGYCIPGIVVSADALLVQNPGPSESQVRESISGHLCRCGNYAKIVKAIQVAAERSLD